MGLDTDYYGCNDFEKGAYGDEDDISFCSELSKSSLRVSWSLPVDSLYIPSLLAPFFSESLANFSPLPLAGAPDLPPRKALALAVCLYFC